MRCEVSATATSTSNKFLAEVIRETPNGERIKSCIQCGTCGGSCPSAQAMDHTPRMLFAMLRAGMREDVLKSNTPWICVSCYHCVVRCPQEIHITDVMYALKSMAIEAKLYQDSTAPDFSQTFIGMVEEFGRSFELGLASWHYLKHFPLRLPSMMPMGLLISWATPAAMVPREASFSELMIWRSRVLVSVMSRAIPSTY